MKKIIVLAISLVLAFNLYAQPKSNGNIPASTRYQVTNIQIYKVPIQQVQDYMVIFQFRILQELRLLKFLFMKFLQRTKRFLLRYLIIRPVFAQINILVGQDQVGISMQVVPFIARFRIFLMNIQIHNALVQRIQVTTSIIIYFLTQTGINYLICVIQLKVKVHQRIRSQIYSPSIFSVFQVISI